MMLTMNARAMTEIETGDLPVLRDTTGIVICMAGMKWADKATFRWEKLGEQMAENIRIFPEDDNPASNTLQIPNANYENSGIYRCTAKLGNLQERQDIRVIVRDETRVNCGVHSAPTCKDCPDIHGRVWCNGDCAWIHSSEECVLIPGNTTVTDIGDHEDEKYIVKAYSCLDDETKHLSTISLTQIKHCHIKDFTNYEKK